MLSYALAATCSLTLRERQQLLESPTAAARLELLRRLMRSEVRAIRAVLLPGDGGRPVRLEPQLTAAPPSFLAESSHPRPGKVASRRILGPEGCRVVASSAAGGRVDASPRDDVDVE